MSGHTEFSAMFIPVYRIGLVAGRVGILLAAAGFALSVPAYAAESPDISTDADSVVAACPEPCGNGTPCYGQINPSALAAPPCGLCSYARIWLRPGCVPPSFCKYRCCDSTHIWDGYCNQQSEKLNRQLTRQLYYTQREHIARGWPWQGGYYGQVPCPGFGPAAMGGGPVPMQMQNGVPCEGEGEADVVSDEVVAKGPVEADASRSVRPIPPAPAPPARIVPLPPIEIPEPGTADATRYN